MSSTGLFEVERDGDVVVITPTADLRESDYQDIESGGKAVLDHLTPPEIKGVVLDFHRTDYYGSTALGFFLRLWKRMSARGGRLAFCNLSDHEKEILLVTRLDTLWPVCASREEALRKVRG
jgi:anti-sigma B factor antagonist